MIILLHQADPLQSLKHNCLSNIHTGLPVASSSLPLFPESPMMNLSSNLSRHAYGYNEPDIPNRVPDAFPMSTKRKERDMRVPDERLCVSVLPDPYNAAMVTLCLIFEIS
jgi:hypothetical protein